MHEARSVLRNFLDRAKTAIQRKESKSRLPLGIPEAHAAQRALHSVLSFFGLVALFVALMFIPAVASLTAVSRGTAVMVGVAWIACCTAATVAYHLEGPSRRYAFFDAVESFSLQAGVCLLVYRSGGAVSVFWLAYLGHVQLIAALGFYALNLAMIAIGPVGLVLGFWLHGDRASAFLSLLIGAMGALVYATMARMYSALEASRAREAQLKTSLARFRVGEERNRIARDLHDGVGGELAALAWRLRQIPILPEGTNREASASELEHLDDRLRGVLGNLRRVVLDLREEPRSWVDLLAALRERCQDLCARRELDFHVSGALDASPAQRLAEDLPCIVGELVRNAARHGNPRRVEVRIRIGDGIELSVSDDGIGLPREHVDQPFGGLANVRNRTTQLGGELTLRSGAWGTHVQVQLPSCRRLGRERDESAAE